MAHFAAHYRAFPFRKCRMMRLAELREFSLVTGPAALCTDISTRFGRNGSRGNRCRAMRRWKSLRNGPSASQKGNTEGQNDRRIFHWRMTKHGKGHNCTAARRASSPGFRHKQALPSQRREILGFLAGSMGAFTQELRGTYCNPSQIAVLHATLRATARRIAARQMYLRLDRSNRHAPGRMDQCWTAFTPHPLCRPATVPASEAGKNGGHREDTGMARAATRGLSQTHYGPPRGETQSIGSADNERYT